MSGDSEVAVGLEGQVRVPSILHSRVIGTVRVLAEKQAIPSAAAVVADKEQVGVNMVFAGSRTKAVGEARSDTKEWRTEVGCNWSGNLSLGWIGTGDCRVACLDDHFRFDFPGCCVAGRCCAGHHEICPSGKEAVWRNPCG